MIRNCGSCSMFMIDTEDSDCVRYISYIPMYPSYTTGYKLVASDISSIIKWTKTGGISQLQPASSEAFRAQGMAQIDQLLKICLVYDIITLLHYTLWHVWNHVCVTRHKICCYVQVHVSSYVSVFTAEQHKSAAEIQLSWTGWLGPHTM